MMYIHQKTHSNIFKNNWKIPVVFLVIVGAVLFFLRDSIVKLVRPVSSISEHSIGIFQTRRKIQEENTNLHARIAELESQVAEISLLHDENNSLRSLLKYTKNPETIITTANVIGKPGVSLFDQMVINQGANAGIHQGDLVIVGDSVLLGTIAHVYDDTAVIDLYSRNGYIHDNGFIIKTLGVNVKGNGNGNGNFIFQVPIGVQVIDNDVVTLPEYPDKVIAIIKTIDTDPRSPFQKALARTPVNINELKFVQVVRP